VFASFTFTVCCCPWWLACRDPEALASLLVSSGVGLELWRLAEKLGTVPQPAGGPGPGEVVSLGGVDSEEWEAGWEYYPGANDVGVKGWKVGDVQKWARGIGLSSGDADRLQLNGRQLLHGGPLGLGVTLEKLGLSAEGLQAVLAGLTEVVVPGVRNRARSIVEIAFKP
jgi:hypothetical protein